MSVAPRNVKSRSGCSTCKQRRIKCDEAKPQCNQCVQKRLECPGYGPRWKWSSKHEKHSGIQVRKTSISSRTTAKTKAILRPAHDGAEVNRTTTPGSSDSPCLVIDRLYYGTPDEQLVNDYERGILYDDDNEIFSDDPTEFNLQKDLSPETLGSHSARSAASDIPESSISKSFDRSALAVSQHILQPPDTILSNPQIQVDYFTQKICKVLSAFDSDCNSFRKLAISRSKESLLFFSLFRFITAAYLSSSASKTDGTIIVRNAQAETLHRLQNEVAQLDPSNPTKIEDVLLAVIMFGLSANWDGSNSPSIFHYNGAVHLYHYAYPDRTVPPPRGGHQEFSLYALTYWWMGLSFITDTTEYCVLEPPSTEICHENFHTRQDKRVPHPLIGVCPEPHVLLGQVGRLIHKQRVRSRRKCFISVSTLQTDLEALQRAQRLEKKVLSLSLPDEDNYVDISDPNTPLADLFNIAEMHRLSALILLYRAFPDLLDNRLGLAVSSLGSGQLELARLSWVTMLACYALELLGQSSPRSGTRSIEQILLVIIAGELRQNLVSMDLCASITTDDSDFGALVAAMSASPIRAAMSQNSCSTLRTFEKEDYSHQESFDLHDNPAAEHISEARATVLKRLKAIREILPYKSLEMVEELILKTWAQNGYEQGEVFWMDVMIDNDWKFLLV